MTTIAHLTDLHLLEEGHDRRRRGADRLRLSFLTFGRPTDAEQRRCRALAALVVESTRPTLTVAGEVG